MAPRTPSVRVFISSTFRDMNAERDYLNAFVFPRIKEYCAKRYLDFTHIDLRWGIPEEDSRNGLVLTTCIEEVDNSRPFFIGILGERYGWTPSLNELNALRPSVENQRQWLTEKIKQGASITEMELEYGVLRDMNMSHACFFIKNSDADTPEEFKEPEGSAASHRLKTLKAQIKEQRKYPVHNYSKPDELGSILYNELITMIEAEYPPSDNDRETAIISRHEHALATKSQTLFDLSNTRSFFDRWIKEGKRAFLLQGAPGSGTSWALAYCTADLRKVYSNNKILYYDFECADPSLAPMEDFLDFMSFASCSLPADEWSMVAIDNCSLLTEDEVDRMLRWIDTAGTNTHIVIAADNQSPLALSLTFNRRGPNINFHPLPIDLRRQFINNYTLKYSKRLTQEQIELLANGKSSDYPTTLKMSLNAVVNYGLMEGLDDFIKEVANNKQVFLFYDLIRKGHRLFSSVNLQKEYFQVTSALSLVPNGISEQDLLDMFKIPQSKWAVIKPYVMQFCKGNSRRMQFINSEWHHQMKMYWSTNLRSAIGMQIVDAIFADTDRFPRMTETIVTIFNDIWHLPHDDEKEYARMKHIIYKLLMSPDAILKLDNRLLGSFWGLAQTLRFEFQGQPDNVYGRKVKELQPDEAIIYCQRQADICSNNGQSAAATCFYRLAASIISPIKPTEAIVLEAEALIEEGKAKKAINLIEEARILPAKHGITGLFSRKKTATDVPLIIVIRCFLLLLKAYARLSNFKKVMSTIERCLIHIENVSEFTDEETSELQTLMCEYINILSLYGDSDSLKEAVKQSNDISEDIAKLGIDNKTSYIFMWAKAIRSARRADWKAAIDDSYWCEWAALLCFGGGSYQFGRAHLLYTYAYFKQNKELPYDSNGSAIKGMYRVRNYHRTLNRVDIDSADSELRKTLLNENLFFDKLLLEFQHPKEHKSIIEKGELFKKQLHL